MHEICGLESVRAMKGQAMLCFLTSQMKNEIPMQ